MDGEKQPAQGSPAERARALEPTARAYQELWLSLAQKHWRSLVLVPVDPGTSAMEPARVLAEVGTQLSDAPVSLLLAEHLDAPGGGLTVPERVRAKTITNRIRSLGHGTEPGQLIVAVEPVTVEPLGVLIARAADLVVLCVEMRQSRSEAVRRTQSLIGKERIAGCLLLE
jgi:hypothetical protein